MFPVISLFGFEIQTYSILAALGFAVTAFTAVHIGKSREIPPDIGLFAVLASTAGVFAGGHILFAITNIKRIVELINSGNLSFGALVPFISGMVFYGGLIGSLITLWMFTKISKEVSKGDFFDVFAVSAPLFHFFGRIGCFLAGCCYGFESDFGITTYHNPSAVHYGVSRFPVQLVEAFVNLLIFLFLIYMYKKKKLRSKLVLLYLGIYAPARFVLEFFRGDEVRGFLFGISTSQFISLMIIFALLIYTLIVLIKFFKNSSKTN